jgi:flagellar operon protein
MVNPVSSVQPGRISPAELEARRGGLPSQANSSTANPFADALQAELGSQLRFSTHAKERLRTREIPFTAQDEAALNKAVTMAQEKGAKESLIVLDDLALIVSIKNRTVITAMERAQQQGNVFTNIDSAVLLHSDQQ